MDEQRKKKLNEIIGHIESAIRLIDEFYPSRPGDRAFTKCEEAILWSQVLANNIQLKHTNETNVQDFIVKQEEIPEVELDTLVKEA